VKEAFGTWACINSHLKAEKSHYLTTNYLDWHGFLRTGVELFEIVVATWCLTWHSALSSSQVMSGIVVDENSVSYDPAIKVLVKMAHFPRAEAGADMIAHNWARWTGGTDSTKHSCSRRPCVVLRCLTTKIYALKLPLRFISGMPDLPLNLATKRTIKWMQPTNAREKGTRPGCQRGCQFISSCSKTCSGAISSTKSVIQQAARCCLLASAVVRHD